MFAPKRGDTFDEFVELAKDLFVVEVKENYDETLWKTHCEVRKFGPNKFFVHIFHEERFCICYSCEWSQMNILGFACIFLNIEVMEMHCDLYDVRIIIYFAVVVIDCL